MFFLNYLVGQNLNSFIQSKDLSTALVGKFTDGQIVLAREARLEGLTCRLLVLDHLSSYLAIRDDIYQTTDLRP